MVEERWIDDRTETDEVCAFNYYAKYRVSTQTINE